MGYNIYIRRVAFPDSGGTVEHPITEKEWRVVASKDIDLHQDVTYRLSEENSAGEIYRAHPWILRTYPDSPPLWYRDGAIFATEPDHHTMKKMFALAEKLRAEVVDGAGRVIKPVSAVTNDPELLRLHRKWQTAAFLKVLGVFVFVGIVFGVLCRFNAAQLLIPLGLPLGWMLVLHGYFFDIEGKMTIFGDLLLLGTAILLAWLVSTVSVVTCNFLPDVASCAEKVDRIRSSCAFAVSFPLGIASFSMWLWFRIRQLRKR